jgi:hypothetical protein
MDSDMYLDMLPAKPAAAVQAAAVPRKVKTYTEFICAGSASLI